MLFLNKYNYFTSINDTLFKMLKLKLATDPRWVDLAKKDLSEILTDHAYCEQKATTACIS